MNQARVSVRALVVAVSLSVVAAMFSTSQAASSPSVTDSDGDGVLDAATTELAVQAAVAEGEPVEDRSQWSTTRTVVVNPDGETFKLTEHGSPIRVEQSGELVPVDYDLKRNGDGSCRPHEDLQGAAQHWNETLETLRCQSLRNG